MKDVIFDEGWLTGNTNTGHWYTATVENVQSNKLLVIISHVIPRCELTFQISYVQILYSSVHTVFMYFEWERIKDSLILIS